MIVPPSIVLSVCTTLHTRDLLAGIPAGRSTNAKFELDSVLLLTFKAKEGDTQPAMLGIRSGWQ